MHHIIYFSQASQPLTDAALTALLGQAHRGNDERGVTGALVYGNGQFMQVLEGEQPVVAALYERIARDPRHKGVFKLADKAIDARSFSTWSMAFKVVSPARFAQLVGYRDPAQLAHQLPTAQVADAIILNMMRELLVPGTPNWAANWSAFRHHAAPSMTPRSLLPADEAARLRAVHRHTVAPLLREPLFEEFVRLTAHVFDLPISLISLMAADEAVYIANTGLPGLDRQPRVEAICALAVRERQAVVFADLTNAERHRLTSEALAAAQAKNLQFYAGVPLRMPDQVDIGTLCVIDHRPRAFDPTETQALEKIAEVVALALTARHYCLTVGLGEHHWQTLQDELVEQIEALSALVRYMLARTGAQIPVSAPVLTSVMRRLQDLYDTLNDYLASKA